MFNTSSSEFVPNNGRTERIQEGRQALFVIFKHKYVKVSKIIDLCTKMLVYFVIRFEWRLLSENHACIAPWFLLSSHQHVSLIEGRVSRDFEHVRASRFLLRQVLSANL
jgi:hypothetical protein